MTDAHARLRARILSASLPDDVHVVELEGKEAISELFSFTLTLRVPAAAAVDADEVIGSRATIAFDQLVGDKYTTIRHIHGVIHRCEDLLRVGDARAYRVQIVPRLWLSTLVETLDIFQETSVPEIVQQKLGQLHLSTDDDRELRLQNTYRAGEFTVQYEETDLAFMSRLTEHLGISFVFEHGDEVEKVVLIDHAAGFQPLSAPIAYAPGHNQGGVFDLVADSQIVPSNFFVRDYNYRNPSVDLMAEDSFEGFGGGVVEYGSHFKDPDEGKHIAGVRRQEKECRRRVYRGEAGDPRLSAGHRTIVTGHPYGDIELLPFVVEHHLTQGDFGARETASPPVYRCRFQAIDASLTFRPERRTPKPRITGMVTGIVDGTGTDDYADIDDDGRYRVRFMFDTSGAGEGKASRPVRMMQPHAGGGFGMHFPLRRGTEVLITFIGGDPDRPIICGTVPNPQTPSPVGAGNNRRNIIRTGGNNEINIDDTAGSERIKLTTPHDDTVFQLGAPNAPEQGAALQTRGAYTAVASSGTGVLSAMDASVQMRTALKLAGSIVTEAKPLDLTKLIALGLTGLQQLSKAALAVAQTAKAALEAWDKCEHEQVVEAQKAASTKWETLLAKHSKDDAFGAALQDQKRAYDRALGHRRKSDEAHKASIGLWKDPLQARAQLERLEKEQTSYRKAREGVIRDLNTICDDMAEDDPRAVAIREIVKAENAAEDARHEFLAQQQARSELHTQVDTYIINLKAISEGVSTVKALYSYVLAAIAFAKTTQRVAELHAQWVDIVRTTQRSQQRDSLLRVSCPSIGGPLGAPTPKKLLDKGLSLFAGPPIHSLGSADRTEVFGKNSLTLWSSDVRIFADEEEGSPGKLHMVASKEARLASADRMHIASSHLATITSTNIEVMALGPNPKGGTRGINMFVASGEHKPGWGAFIREHEFAVGRTNFKSGAEPPSLVDTDESPGLGIAKEHFYLGTSGCQLRWDESLGMAISCNDHFKAEVREDTAWTMHGAYSADVTKTYRVSATDNVTIESDKTVVIGRKGATPIAVHPRRIELG